MRISAGQKWSVAIMAVSVNLVFVYAAGMFTPVSYGLMLFSALATYALTCEALYGTALLAYVVTGGIALFIVPDKLTAVLYLALMGHYPVFKSYVDSRGINRLAAWCVRLLYCNLWLIAGICFVLFISGQHMPADLPVPVWACVLIIEAGFIVMDIIHSVFRKIYVEKFRTGIVPKR